MPLPIIGSGKFSAGSNFLCGENVIVDVAEEVILGDNCTLSDNAYLGGRRIEIGNYFYGYSWEWKRLDIGRGRRDEENAVLTVGNRCTFHDNRIDLAHKVEIGHDVGLSPEAVIYTHYYWQSVLEGYPCACAPVWISSGAIIGFRSVLLPASHVGENTVVGAQSVVTRALLPDSVYAGNPAELVRGIVPKSSEEQYLWLVAFIPEYQRTLEYRGLPAQELVRWYCCLRFRNCILDCGAGTIEGTEDEFTDDLRTFLFRKGIRIYTQRPFKSLARQGSKQFSGDA